MATRSAIGVLTKNGIVSIYCHYDGYLEGVGKTLVNHYTDEKDIMELISLGGISQLGKRVKPKGEHSFTNKEEGTTVAYARDRGKDVEIDKIKVDKNSSIKDIMGKYYDYYQTAPYVYLYLPKEKKWICYYSDTFSNKLIEVKTGKSLIPQNKKIRITREESVDIARILRKNKEKTFFLYGKDGKVILVDNNENNLHEQGFTALTHINWNHINSNTYGDKLTQKQAADFIYRMYNEK